MSDVTIKERYINFDNALEHLKEIKESLVKAGEEIEKIQDEKEELYRENKRLRERIEALEAPHE